MDGLLLIYKEKGCTSRDVVNRVSRKLNIRKMGHTGTLDPLATGLLVLCLGKATKLTEIVSGTDKEYTAQVTLGLLTDTLDSTGKILQEEEVSVTKEQIVQSITSMVGTYEQEVPIYSAIKVKGKKLYDYARQGRVVKLPKRKVMIKSLELVSEIKEEQGKIVFWIHADVSKGTYIRSLVRDLATNLGTIGVMSELRRTRQGNFHAEDACLIDDLKLDQLPLHSMEEAIAHYPAVIADEILQKEIQNGKLLPNQYGEFTVAFFDQNGKVLALYQIYEKDPTYLKPWKMLNIEN